MRFVRSLRSRSDTSRSAWIEGEHDVDPRGFIIVNNGLLDISTRTLEPHTAELFAVNAVPFDYDPDAGKPWLWLHFLEEDLWPNDPESVQTLQELFGYALTLDTTQQKLFLLVGPKRSGKGTIARILTKLVGGANVVAPTLAGLGTNFGIAPLIGKQLAIISDARVSGRADQHVIAERLLSISGEDAITVDRKYSNAWTGQLSARFVILTNELPRLADASGALASRFIVLVLENSFYGREDRKLTDKLTEELPGIFLWALEGLDRLRERGYFLQPESAREAAEQLEIETLGAPVKAFLDERCEVGPGKWVAVDSLYEAYRAWCDNQGVKSPSTKNTFGRDLFAALPGLRKARPRKGMDRSQRYHGVGLKSWSESGS